MLGEGKTPLRPQTCRSVCHRETHGGEEAGCEQEGTYTSRRGFRFRGQTSEWGLGRSKDTLVQQNRLCHCSAPGDRCLGLGPQHVAAAPRRGLHARRPHGMHCDPQVPWPCVGQSCSPLPRASSTAPGTLGSPPCFCHHRLNQHSGTNAPGVSDAQAGEGRLHPAPGPGLAPHGPRRKRPGPRE